MISRDTFALCTLHSRPLSGVLVSPHAPAAVVVAFLLVGVGVILCVWASDLGVRLLLWSSPPLPSRCVSAASACLLDGGRPRSRTPPRGGRSPPRSNGAGATSRDAGRRSPALGATQAPPTARSGRSRSPPPRQGGSSGRPASPPRNVGGVRNSGGSSSYDSYRDAAPRGRSPPPRERERGRSPPRAQQSSPPRDTRKQEPVHTAEDTAMMNRRAQDAARVAERDRMHRQISAESSSSAAPVSAPVSSSLPVARGRSPPRDSTRDRPREVDDRSRDVRRDEASRDDRRRDDYSQYRSREVDRREDRPRVVDSRYSDSMRSDAPRVVSDRDRRPPSPRGGARSDREREQQREDARPRSHDRSRSRSRDRRPASRSHQETQSEAPSSSNSSNKRRREDDEAAAAGASDYSRRHQSEHPRDSSSRPTDSSPQSFHVNRVSVSSLPPAPVQEPQHPQPASQVVRAPKVISLRRHAEAASTSPPPVRLASIVAAAGGVPAAPRRQFDSSVGAHTLAPVSVQVSAGRIRTFDSSSSWSGGAVSVTHQVALAGEFLSSVYPAPAVAFAAAPRVVQRSDDVRVTLSGGGAYPAAHIPKQIVLKGQQQQHHHKHQDDQQPRHKKRRN